MAVQICCPRCRGQFQCDKERWPPGFTARMMCMSEYDSDNGIDGSLIVSISSCLLACRGTLLLRGRRAIVSKIWSPGTGSHSLSSTLITAPRAWLNCDAPAHHLDTIVSVASVHLDYSSHTVGASLSDQSAPQPLHQSSAVQAVRSQGPSGGAGLFPLFCVVTILNLSNCRFPSTHRAAGVRSGDQRQSISQSNLSDHYSFV